MNEADGVETETYYDLFLLKNCPSLREAEGV